MGIYGIGLPPGTFETKPKCITVNNRLSSFPIIGQIQKFNTGFCKSSDYFSERYLLLKMLFLFGFFCSEIGFSFSEKTRSNLFLLANFAA